MITRRGELAVLDRAGALTGPADADRFVSDATRRRILDAVPANTVRAYTRQWAAFTTWCTASGRTGLPATAETLTEYVAHLADDGHAPATIEQALAAIRTAHRTAGHAGQPDTEGARLVLRGHRRQRASTGHRSRQATPVTIDTLRTMIEH
ncbi:MAG: site-specific integrase, partial [Actinobacteria bacterium]|nr:site-specific integrase [Actinomycetota bacterium]